MSELQHQFRFFDVEEELLLTTAAIIDEYQQTRYESFETATLSLLSVIPDVNSMVELVKGKCHQSDNHLSQSESNSIRLYTLEWTTKKSSIFYTFNQALRSEDKQHIKPWLHFLKLLTTALNRLPSNRCTVYRASNVDLSDKYPINLCFIWPSFGSCKKNNYLPDRTDSIGATGSKTLFVIHCYSCKDIRRHSMYEDEDEMLLPPGCRFKVMNVTESAHGYHIIELKEIPTEIGFIIKPSVEAPKTQPINTQAVNIPFHPISTVSLSKKLLHSTLPNTKLERQLVNAGQGSQISLKAIGLTNLDMDSVISEAIVKRRCILLDLSKNKITHLGIVALANILKRNKIRSIEAALQLTLVSLYLSSNKIGDNGAEYLSEALKKNTTLAVLNLSSTDIELKGVEYLSEALESNQTLTELELYRNQIKDEGLKRISQALLINKTLTTLGLHDTKLTGVEMQSLSGALRVNTTLSSLDLSSNNIDDRGTQQLAVGLRENTKLNKLNIMWNNIEDEGMRCLCEALKHNATLAILELRGNRIGNRGTQYLSELLQTNAALTTLDLSSAQIEENGCQYLSQALLTNFTLKKLDLSNNRIGPVGTQHLCDGLIQNATLTDLNLSENQIEDRGAQHLGRVLVRSTALTVLQLWSNNITDGGALSLAESLLLNSILRTLDLSYNRIGRNGITVLREAARANQIPCSLIIEDCGIL